MLRFYSLTYTHIPLRVRRVDELFIYGKKDFTEVSKNLVRCGFENNFNELSK